MSPSITVEQDRLQVPPERPAHWSENAVCIFNAPDAGLAVYTHFSRVAPDPTIWEGILTVYLPDGELVVSRSFSASASDTVIDAGAITFTCVEPLQHWRLEYNGMARRVHSSELAAGFLADGAVEPVEITLDMHGVTPVWALGHMPDQSWGDFHLEQECQIDGTITIGGEPIAISTLGMRDHSRGVRTYGSLVRECWSYGFFPSGKRYVALHLTNAGGPDLVTGYYFDGETTHRVTAVEAPDLPAPDASPRTYEVRFSGDFGTLTVEGTLNHACPYALAHPIGQPLGFDSTQDPATLIVEGPATVALNGETGQGWLERVAQSAKLALHAAD